MDYQQKYLKYKNKYLELKKQIYGGLRVDDLGRKDWQSKVALPLTITDRMVVKIDRAEGRCLVKDCQCAGYESTGGHSIGMMEDPHPSPMRGHLVNGEPYRPKIFERSCEHCDHNLGSHALKAGLNEAGQIVNFISYKNWVEHLVNNKPLEPVSLYEFEHDYGDGKGIYAKLRDPTQLGLLEFPETIIKQDKKGEEGRIHTKYAWTTQS